MFPILFLSFISLHSTPLLLSLFTPTAQAVYVLQDDYFAFGDFFSNFDFFSSADPTNGFVSYKTEAEAWAAALISNSSTSSTVYMGVDSTHVTPYGRNSVRIVSKKSYNSGLVVLDLEHMPGGICGTWPAFWMVGPNWPSGGEIDILEGANDQTTNDVTLHTGPGCSFSDTGDFSGLLKYTSCASSGSDNNGCQIGATSTASFGAGFNANGGGIYAMEWTSQSISVWFFPRNGLIPDDVLGASPAPQNWGTPVAKFSGGACDIATAFTAQQMVFDTTFCGDWAGQAWAESGSCAAVAATCDAFVANNPSAFEEAYWEVNALKVYSAQGAPASTSSAYTESGAWATPVAAKVVVVPTTFAVAASPTTTAKTVQYEAGKGRASSASSATSAVETGTGVAVVLGADGTVAVEEVASAPKPSATPERGWFATLADGTVGYHRRARHLAQHKRPSGRRL